MQASKTRHMRPSQNAVRKFTKRIYNPIIKKFAGHRVYALVKHVGRRSGKQYATPVVVEQTPDGFVIPLAYSQDADWCRNVLAAGHFSLQHRGITYQVESPKIVEAKTALVAFPIVMQLLFRLFRVDQFLHVRCINNN